MFTSKLSAFYLIQISALLLSCSASQYPKITWLTCGDSSLPRECGQFDVPLDYQNVAAGKAKLSVIRFNATTSPRLGTLFVNPGGPGMSGRVVMRHQL